MSLLSSIVKDAKRFVALVREPLIPPSDDGSLW
jgi:hypothetical protein